MKNRNWKQEIKEWWNENKNAIKAGDDFVLDESNCDDPELLDLIRSEIENS